MIPSDLSIELSKLFGTTVMQMAPGSWQVDTPDFRLLILLSEDESWLRLLVAIATLQDAQPFFEQLLEANFDRTQEVRYALQQGVLWAVFQHSLAGLAVADFRTAIQRLIDLRLKGLDECFTRLIENRVRQIIRVSKQQGQTLEATLQTLERFYEEGLMGDMAAGTQARADTLAAWRYQLERLWNEEDTTND